MHHIALYHDARLSAIYMNFVLITYTWINPTKKNVDHAVSEGSTNPEMISEMPCI